MSFKPRRRATRTLLTAAAGGAACLSVAACHVNGIYVDCASDPGAEGCPGFDGGEPTDAGDASTGVDGGEDAGTVMGLFPNDGG
jgi:hypothetical protein